VENSQEDRKCMNCEYFSREQHNTTAGQCHRYAPKPSPLHPTAIIQGQGVWEVAPWPRVGVNTWCGEFSQKVEQPAQKEASEEIYQNPN